VDLILMKKVRGLGELGDAELERDAIEALAAAELRKSRLEGVIVTIPRKAGDEGRLFGSVGTSDIATAITEGGLGVELLKSEVRLPDGPFRAVGDYDVELHLHSDVSVSVRIEVIPAS